MLSSAYFKHCATCQFDWPSRDFFLADPAVTLIGYMPHFENLKLGLFLFNHVSPSCGTTLAVSAGAFTDIYQGEGFTEDLYGSPGCLGLCDRWLDTSRCTQKCECAFIREVMQVVKQWPKQEPVPVATRPT